MNILVTGATGFIGKNLVGFLQKKGHTVFAGTRSSIKAMSLENGFWVPEDAHGVADRMKEEKIEWVIHLGADSAINSNDRQQLIRNVSYTKNLMQACSGQKFIFASTVMVYPNSTPYFEEPQDEYSLSKLLCEQVGEYYFNKGNLYSLFCLRMCGILGPHLEKGIVYKILTSDEEVKLYGESPGSILGFLDIEDFTSLIGNIIQQSVKYYSVFDVCPDDVISLKELADVYGKKVNWTPGKNRTVKGNNYYARSHFKWRADYTTRQAIRRYYFSLKADYENKCN